MYHGPDRLPRNLHLGYEKGVAELKAGTAWCKSPAFWLSARSSENPNVGSLDWRSESVMKLYHCKDMEECGSPLEDCVVSSLPFGKCPDAAMRWYTKVDWHGAAMSEGWYCHLVDWVNVGREVTAGSCVSEAEASDLLGKYSVIYFWVHG